MKILVLYILFLAAFSGNAQISTKKELADVAFQKGKFEEARAGYETLFSQNAKSIDVLKQLARIALLENNLELAASRTEDILAISQEDSVGNFLMAEILHRQDRYAEAAPFYLKSKRETIAKLMASFSGESPYQIQNIGPNGKTTIVLEQTDPLPLIMISINNVDSLFFLIDTGGSDVIIDKDLADKLNVTSFGKVTGTFAGGRKSAVEIGKIKTLKAADLFVSNIPVHIMNTKPYSQIANGKPVSGIIGTIFFYHFLSTLDYKNGSITFARKGNHAVTDNHKTIPFWMAFTHLMVTEGSVNDTGQSLMFVDTGLAMAGVGFTCPESTLKEAGLQPIEGQAIVGQGGGGTIQVVPFQVEKIQLGHFSKTGLMGITGAFPAVLEFGMGFRIAGLVSHEFFKGTTVTFDFERMAIEIE